MKIMFSIRKKQIILIFTACACLISMSS